MNRLLSRAAKAACALAAITALNSPSRASADAIAPPGGSAWDVSSKTSALDGKTTYVAGLMSSNQLTNSAGVDKPVRLVIRCTPENGLETYIAWPIYMGSDDQSDAYKLDDQPIVRELWGGGKAGTSTFLQEDAKGFLAKLALSKRLVVQATPYHQTPSEAVFDLTGIAEVAAAALKACP